MIDMPVILIMNKSDDRVGLGVVREWQGRVPEGWIQIGYVEPNGKRHVNYELEGQT